MIFRHRRAMAGTLSAVAVVTAGCSSSSDRPDGQTVAPTPRATTSSPSPQPDPTATESIYCQEVRRFLQEGNRLEDLTGPNGQEKAVELRESLELIADNAPEAVKPFWQSAANLADAVSEGRPPAIEDLTRALGGATEAGRQAGRDCDLPEPTVEFAASASVQRSPVLSI